MSKIQSVGIDLGTSNCALALSDKYGVEVLDITQIVGTNRIGEDRLFASALYIPNEGQFNQESIRLPWAKKENPYILGNFAREIGAQVPDRLVTSAKSWLCNHNIDPRKPLLPWKSEIVDKKLSAMEVTQLYLHHLRKVFKIECDKRGKTSDLNETQVVITIPASFDEAARTITAQAAVNAGWGEEVILLEEPQAAFYAWLGSTDTKWREQVKAGDIILICDVGGGTTDLSLITVSEKAGDLELERISVGRHILLGGDNMDLALAYALRQQLVGEGEKIDDWQLLALIQSSRKAKEQLFENEDLQSVAISIPSRGSRLLGGTATTTLSRNTLHDVIVNGFFAKTEVGVMPLQETSIGLQEFGLPYAADPVISKHCAEFLTKSFKNVLSNKALTKFLTTRGNKFKGTNIQPDAVLFNGGVFRAKQLREQVIDVLNDWSSGGQVRELVGTNFEIAVAQGASIYGNIKISGKGIRIRSGVARSYYIGLEPSMLAIPGFKPPIKAVCVAEQGMEEGEERVLKGKEFGLITGATVKFRFFSASDRAGDSVGLIIQNAEKELEETTSLEMTLPELEEREESSAIPVMLHSRLNELGILQLWMQHTFSEKKWELNFSVRTE